MEVIGDLEKCVIEIQRRHHQPGSFQGVLPSGENWAVPGKGIGDIPNLPRRLFFLFHLVGVRFDGRVIAAAGWRGLVPCEHLIMTGKVRRAAEGSETSTLTGQWRGTAVDGAHGGTAGLWA